METVKLSSTLFRRQFVPIAEFYLMVVLVAEPTIFDKIIGREIAADIIFEDDKVSSRSLVTIFIMLYFHSSACDWLHYLSTLRFR